MRQVFACIWRAHEPDATFKQEEFEKRIPRLMVWLRDLKSKGKLIACGGGGFPTHSGGLTLIAADNPEEAKKLSEGTPMNEIGATELFLWDCFYADLVHKDNEAKLK
ncbi:MAG: hypothetical protein FD180_521 [Planctomycetota bacterium]|nr:MAG: hypothetical protein FD180_521 [Planctomycetota bacterium]